MSWVGYVTTLALFLETTSLIEWRWVPTAMNVADDATRDKVGTVTINSRWLKGPEFLKSPYCSWPQEPHVDNIKLEHVKPSAKFINVNNLFFISVDNTPIFKSLVADSSRFSNWFRFLRSTARAHQFIDCLRNRDSVSPQASHTVHTSNAHQLRPITAKDLRSAKTHIFLQSQEEFFPEELAALRLKESIPRYSKVIKFDLMLGSEGLIRLSGRIGVIENVVTHTNNPILLDSRIGAVKLLIMSYHQKLNHANNETVISELRQEFWILKLRIAVKSIARTCQLCRIKRATPSKPLKGNLPKSRLALHRRPFSFVGLDYFGPILITVGRRHEKRYVALYTCLTTRSVRLEVVHDLSTDAALMSLRRFVARRGLPVEIWSDNGTAFVGASKFLRQLYGPPVEDFVGNQNISWNFIPPSAPSMGGAWERLVRSVKSALKATLTERYPKEAVLTTLLTEAEAIVTPYH